MRWKIVLPIAAVVAVIVVVVLVVAGGDSKSDKALAQVCGARADIATQVKTLQGLTLANAGQAKTSLQAIADDVRTIADARADLAEDRRGQVQAANDAFASAVKDSLGGVTSLASLRTAGTQVRDGGADARRGVPHELRQDRLQRHLGSPLRGGDQLVRAARAATPARRAR